MSPQPWLRWPSTPPRRPPRPLRACAAALTLLTVAPIPQAWLPDDEAEWGAAVACFPGVGLALAALLRALAALLDATPAHPLAVAALLVVLWELASGVLHLDGLMDAADGLFGGHSPEARLRIMRDERVGAFGVVAALFVVLLKWAWLRTPALWVAPVLGRWAAAVAVVAFPYAREQGLGRSLKNHARPRHALVATLLALVVVIWQRAWWSALVAVVVLLAFARLVAQRVPGFTGDLYGALVELVEVAVVLTFGLTTPASFVTIHFLWPGSLRF